MNLLDLHDYLNQLMSSGLSGFESLFSPSRRSSKLLSSSSSSFWDGVDSLAAGFTFPPPFPLCQSSLQKSGPSGLGSPVTRHLCWMAFSYAFFTAFFTLGFLFSISLFLSRPESTPSGSSFCRGSHCLQQREQGVG